MAAVNGSTDQRAVRTGVTDRRVTVVIPTRNRQATLAVALCSALEQIDVTVEAIVADQGSVDGTLEMLRQLRDPRVRVIRSEQPLRPAAARNSGLAEVTTPWVAFLDDDDVWARDRLRCQFEAIEAEGALWSLTGEVRFLDGSLRICGTKRPPSPHEIWPGILGANLVPGGGSGVLASTDLVRRLGGFRADIPRSEDWELWIRLAKAARPAVVDRPLVAYRLSRTSRAHGHSSEVNRALHQWMEREYGDLRREHGIIKDEEEFQQYEATTAARAGRRWQAVRLHLRSAVVYRRPKQLIIALATAVSPRLVTAARDRKVLATADPEWLRQGATILEQAYPAGARGRADAVSARPGSADAPVSMPLRFGE
jgi:glycosyltransferase involved in cell wall biosynthesis